MLYLSKLKNNTLNVLFGSIFLNMSAHTKWKSSSIFYQIIRFLSKCFFKKKSSWEFRNVCPPVCEKNICQGDDLNIWTHQHELLKHKDSFSKPCLLFSSLFITNSISLLESEKFWCLFWRRSYTEYWLLHGFLKFSWPNIMAKLTVRAN